MSHSKATFLSRNLTTYSAKARPHLGAQPSTRPFEEMTGAGLCKSESIVLWPRYRTP